VARVGERRAAYRILVRKGDVKRPHGKPRHGSGIDVRMDLQ
jgi:hypothetical protein